VRAGPRGDARRRGRREDDGREQHDGGVERERGRHQGTEQEHPGEQRDRPVAPELADPAGGRREEAGPAADVADDQDRDEEEDHRAEVSYLLQEVVRGERAGGQGRGRGRQADGCLGPAAWVGVGRDQQCQEGRRRHDLGERRHRVNLGHL
jgi:hypothetical protein